MRLVIAILFASCLVSVAAPAAIQHNPWTTTTNDPNVTLQANQPVSITTTNSISLIANGLISTTNNVNGAVNVHAYGAKGNGIADDTAALLQAVAALNAGGGAIYFPPGTYNYSSTIVVTNSGCTIRGDINQRTILKYTGTGSTAFYIGQSTNFVSQIHVSNLSIQGNTNTGVGLRLENVANGCTFVNLRFRGPFTNDCLRLEGVVNCKFDGIYASSNDSYFSEGVPNNGIWIGTSSPLGQPSNSLYFTHLSFTWLLGTAIYVDVGNEITFDFGDIAHCGGRAFYLSSSAGNNRISNFNLDVNTGGEIYVLGDNNILTENGAFGTTTISGNANVVLGGAYQDLIISNLAASTECIAVSYDFNGAGSFTDNSWSTSRCGIRRRSNGSFDVPGRRISDMVYAAGPTLLLGAAGAPEAQLTSAAEFVAPSPNTGSVGSTWSRWLWGVFRNLNLDGSIVHGSGNVTDASGFGEDGDYTLWQGTGSGYISGWENLSTNVLAKGLIVKTHSQYAGARLLTLNDGTNDVVVATQAGNLGVTGALVTGAPTGGSAAEWKLGTVITGASVSLTTTNYVQIEIGGVVYKVGLVQ